MDPGMEEPYRPAGDATDPGRAGPGPVEAEAGRTLPHAAVAVDLAVPAQRLGLDVGARRVGRHDLPVADVHRHVTGLGARPGVVEDEVARLELRLADPRRLVVLGDGVVVEVDAGRRPGVHHQAGAVEPGARGRA